VSSLDPTLLIAFQAKWLPGLAEFVAEGWWSSPGWSGIQFQPAGEGHATIVAQDGAAMVVIQDPKTVMSFNGDEPKVWDVSFRPEFIARCKNEDFEMRSVEGDTVRVQRPDWMRPESVTVLGLGMAERDYRMRAHHAYIKAFADPPGRGELLVEKDDCWINPAHGPGVRWEVIEAAAMESATAPVPVRLNAGYLAKLHFFGHGLEGTFGRDGLTRWTFASAPEVTVYIMPWMPRPGEPVDEERADV